MELAEQSHSTSTQSILIFASIVLYVVYICKAKFRYWTDRGVPCHSLLQSLVHTARLKFGLDSYADSYRKLYLAMDGYKYGGTFELGPKLILRDPQLIQLVLTKGSGHFRDCVPTPNEDLDPYLVQLGNIGGDRWKTVRRKLATAFSSAHLKSMFESLKECAQKTDLHLESLAAETGSFEVDVQPLLYDWYTLEAIEHFTLGVKCYFTKDGNSDFHRLVMDIWRNDYRRVTFNVLSLIHPKLPKLLRWKIMRPDVDRFVLSVYKEAVALTKSDSVDRKGFLQILLDAQEAEKTFIESQQVESPENTEVFFADHVIGGIMADSLLVGGRGMSYRLSLLLYELASNPDVQEKLFAEIKEMEKALGSDVQYETLKNYKYASQVIEELLRKYPGLPNINRICTEPFQIPSTSFVVEKKVKVVISLYGLQRDPQYFPDPEKFNPDRFSDENREKIVPGSYLPYGIGPRNCIASRFATMALKVILIQLVSKYTIHPTERTPNRLVFDPQIFGLASKDKVWLRLQRRA